MTAAEIGGAGRRITITLFRDRAAASREQRELTVDQLAALIRTTTAPEKDALPWLKLARFGNARTALNSLRHDRNVIAVTGIEADYDGERVAFDAAIETAAKAGLQVILYTSPSHAPERPRWRILAPTSREYPPGDRARLLGRLNGLYRGIFAHESWTLSQSYYYGRVDAAPAHRVEVVDGMPIDQLDELDAISLGRPARPAGRGRSASDLGDGGEARDDAELIRRIVTGEGYHVELTALAARYIGRGMDPQAAADMLRGLMLAHPAEARDARWQDRAKSIDAIVRSAAQKFTPGARSRRAVARLTHRMIRRRRSGDEIRTALLAEAERLGITPECALGIGRAILRDKIHGRSRA